MSVVLIDVKYFIFTSYLYLSAFLFYLFLCISFLEDNTRDKEVIGFFGLLTRETYDFASGLIEHLLLFFCFQMLTNLLKLLTHRFLTTSKSNFLARITTAAVSSSGRRIWRSISDMGAVVCRASSALIVMIIKSSSRATSGSISSASIRIERSMSLICLKRNVKVILIGKHNYAVFCLSWNREICLFFYVFDILWIYLVKWSLT